MTRRAAALATALALTLLAAPALAGDWFQHKFGELRSVHGDWLAVCADNGEGACRVTISGKDPGSSAFFDYRLTLYYVEGVNDWNIEVMDRDMPEHALQDMLFDVDGELTRLLPGQFEPGELGIPNVAETVSITDFDFSRTLVPKLQAGNRLTITYTPPGYDGRAAFSLRGISAAMRAVEDHVRQRMN